MVRRTQSDKALALDERLGLHADISRRDFIQGTLFTGLGLSFPLTAAERVAGVGTPDPYYPPRWTGLRGSAPGTFEQAHALVAQAPFEPAQNTGEAYDLVVVGAGISGLSAAHFYLKRHPNARVLLLDNHDDFGGHARRNEFKQDGITRLMNGGTFAIESPRPYSGVADGVLKDLGIDAAALARTAMHPEVYRQYGLTRSIYFDAETFKSSALVAGYEKSNIAFWLQRTPLNANARAAVLRIEHGAQPIWQDIDSDARKRRLLKISYANFLAQVLKAPPEVVALYQSSTKGEWGVGADAVSALDAWGIGLPGFVDLKLAPGSIPGMGFTPAGYADTGGSVFMHFPDGNATIARGLVRTLIPKALPPHGLNALVNVPLNYEALDSPESQAVRLRLKSTVFRVEPSSTPGSGVAISYVRDNTSHTVRAKHCVLACYNMLIPYLVPELPSAQKEALHGLIKTPLVYTSVAIKNWQAFVNLKTYDIHAPNGYHTTTRLSLSVDVGDYRSPRVPSEPNTLWMVRTPCQPGLSEHEQNKAGRAQLLATPFETFEREIRSQLNAMLGHGGFDAKRDITAITVNRWPHGYAPENNSLFDDGNEDIQLRARQPFGDIAIANSDSGGGAYTDVAIEQAFRAVNELG